MPSEPSTDERYLGPDGRPLVLSDDTVNPRTLKWFKRVLENAGIYSADKSVGLNDAQVHDLWKQRTAAFKARPGAFEASRAGGATNERWEKGVRWKADGTKEKVGLTPVQLAYLKAVYYGLYKATLGSTRLWAQIGEAHDPSSLPAFTQALSDAGADLGEEEALRLWEGGRRDLADPVDRRGISHNAMMAWYRRQTVQQLSRDAPAQSQSKSVMPTPETQQILKSVQADVVNMDAYPSAGFGRVLSIIDGFSRFLTQVAMKDETADECAQGVVDWIDSILDVHGRWPHRTVLRADNGSSFGPEFRAQVMDYARSRDVDLVIEQGRPNLPNDQSLIELYQRKWRKATREYLLATGQQMRQWYGANPQQGRRGYNFRHVNGLLNLTVDASLGMQKPAAVWEAAWRALDGDADEADEAVVLRARQEQVERAGKKRGASAAVTEPYPVDTHVRKTSDKYMKASLRGNELKMGLPRAWEEDVHQITQVREGPPGSMPQYKLDGVDGLVSHDRLMRTYGAEQELDEPDTALAGADLRGDWVPEIYDDGQGRTFYSGFPFAES